MRSSRRSDERGQVIPVVALFLVLLTGFVAIVVDAGTGYTDSRRARNVSDASALAAAYTIWAELKATPAATDLTAASAASNAVAVQNSCNVGSCRAATPVYLASDNTTVTSTAQTAKYVRVTVTDASPNGFAQMIGGGRNIAISVTSEASVNSPGGVAGTTLPCDVCVLGDVSFQTSKNDITATDGNIIVDGDVNGSGYITASSPYTIDIEGTNTSTLCKNTVTYPPDATCTVATPVQKGAFVDPGLAPPVTTGLPSKPDPNASTTIDAGVYPSITNSGRGTLTLNPGVYVITGPGGVGGTISASGGVTLYFACSSFPTPCARDQRGAGFSAANNTTLNLTAPTTTNVAVYFDPNNTASFALSNGGATVNIVGAMYMPAATLDVGTQGGGTFGAPIVVQTISIKGASLGDLTGNPVVGGSSAPSPGGLFCLTPPCRT